MVKSLRAIIGTKPEPKSHSISIEKNPNHGAVKGDEDAFISTQTKGATVVPDVQDNDTRAPSKGPKKEGPNVGLKQGLGEEQIDELDRKTLKSYQRKSNTHLNRLHKKIEREEDKAMSTDGNKYPEKQTRHNQNATQAQRKMWQREKGLRMVKKKLGEDVEQVDELTGKTLGSYVQKARVDAEKKRQHSQELNDHPSVKKHTEKRREYYKRKEYDSQGRSKHQNAIDNTYKKEGEAKDKLDPNRARTTNYGARYRGIEKAISKLHRGKLTDH